MKVLTRIFPLHLYGFASPVYWENREAVKICFSKLVDQLRTGIPMEYRESIQSELLFSETDVENLKVTSSARSAGFIPLSGGVQPWMLKMSENFRHVALINTYLSEMKLPEELSEQLLSFNAHPSCTDFYARMKLTGKPCDWLSTMEEWSWYITANHACTRLNHSRLLQIGETEPWVINSCRDPQTFKKSLGIKIQKVSLNKLYATLDTIPPETINEIVASWNNACEHCDGIKAEELRKAAQIYSGVQQLVQDFNADGVTLACFQLIKDFGVTGCMAVSMLNQSPEFIAACEGDLDAAVTLLLLKAIGSKCVWMGNPVIHVDDTMELVHCTAPMKCGDTCLPYTMKPHHESGKGVSLQVTFPSEQTVTLARIGNNVRDLFFTNAMTEDGDHLPTCHSQLHMWVPSSKEIRENLMGTHLVCGFGDMEKELQYCASILSLNRRPDNKEFYRYTR